MCLVASLAAATAMVQPARPIWQTEVSLALKKAARDPTAKYLQLSTVRGGGTDGDAWPSSRTVVFRGWLWDTCALTFVTDNRSGKMEEIQRNSRAEACWYIGKTRDQFRISGTLSLVGDSFDDEKLAKARRAVWNNMSDGAREQFRWPVPGDAYLPADWGDMNGNGAKALLQGVSCRILDPISSQSRPKSRHGILQCPHQSIPTQAPNRSAPSSPLARRSPTLPFRTVSKMPLAPTRHRRLPARPLRHKHAPESGREPSASCRVFSGSRGDGPLECSGV